MKNKLYLIEEEEKLAKIYENIITDKKDLVPVETILEAINLAEKEFEPGIYVDGARGSRDVALIVIRFAKKMGFEPNVESDKDFEEFLYEIEDEAIEFLNQNCGREGYYWGHNDGDFGLYPIEEDQ